MSHPKTISKYQVVEHLGSGSFGDVYRARDRALQAEKAIKILGVTDPAKFVDSLEEAQILNRCSHKHIVTINEANVFKVNGDPRVVLDLEYISEGSLEDALESRWVSCQEAVRHIQGALLGLEHAHAEGFLHRDIKPGNILLAKTGSKLSDFGLATSGSAGLIGSPQGYITHLPPEYWTDNETTALSDVYAAGMTLYRALSNFDDWRAVVRAIPNARKAIEAGKLIDKLGFEEFIPKPLRRIVRKACNPAPTKRYKSAAEFRHQLDRLRFAVDWIALDEFEWEGRAGSDVFIMVATPSTHEVTFKKNGRRKTEKCKSYPSLSEALTAMAKEVADSTLQ